MKRNTGFFWFIIITLLLASMACNIPFLGGSDEPTQAPGSTSLAPKNTPVPGATQPKPSETVKPPVKGPNSVPLPLRQGMASLNTYRLKIHVLASGPTKADKTDLTTLMEVNNKTGNNHIRIEEISSSASDPIPESSITDRYTVGKQSCDVSSSGSDPKATPSAELSDEDQAMGDINNTLATLIDFNIYVENPVFVAEETINGVITNHFTFKVTQLGKDSGAVVNQNSGQYWVAKDGQYLVKYSVILELSSDKAGTKVNHSEMSIELTSINQPVDITFPANCVKK